MATRALFPKGLRSWPTLEKEIRALREKRKKTIGEDRRLADAYRTVLRIFRDFVGDRLSQPVEAGVVPPETLIELAREAFLFLGGQGEPGSLSLKDYDHVTYGPYLGISDEGSAAQVILKAALQTPKACLLKKIEPITVGVSLDAERLGAVGEVAVGPTEYAEIYVGSVGRILTSTNVGTRLNLRYYLNYPVVMVPAGPRLASLEKAKSGLKEKFRPFLKTPDGSPRPLAVYVKFDPIARRSVGEKIAILKDLAAYASKGGIADPKRHRLGLQQPIRFGIRARDAALLAIDMASAAGLRHVALEGIVRRDVEANVSCPGLLNYLAPGLLGPVLRRAAQKGVQVHPKNVVDTDTVARNVWSSLNTARQMGLALGKYGTFPLTLEECNAVIQKVQAWFSDWSAAPVFFLDQGALSRTRVFVGRDVMAGLKEWLDIIGRHGVRVILIDTMDKSKGYRLLRTKDEPKGLLSRAQVQKIDQMASKKGIKTLWAGGITIPQVFEFGKLGVFGIYVTTAVSAARPVGRAYWRDPLLAAEKEPTFEGIYRAKLLLEAGFLSSRNECRRCQDSLEYLSAALVSNIMNKKSEVDIKDAESRLSEKTTAAWKSYWEKRGGLSGRIS
ncbi:MAG: hypothetical protein NTU60_04045 [Candidatus Aminicenantes bacterium]|nr:hypothetical protein [Candidatus Aminicenantes bacterium]